MRHFAKKLKVAVNLSPVQLENPGLVIRIRELIRQYHIDCRRIEIEITETSSLSMSDTSKQNLKDLADMGFSLVLDDFGVGYSNLDYLVALPIKKLKIDSVFTQSISSNKTKQNIIKGIAYLCALEGIELLAEGVENRGTTSNLIKNQNLISTRVLLW